MRAAIEATSRILPLPRCFILSPKRTQILVGVVTWSPIITSALPISPGVSSLK